MYFLCRVSNVLPAMSVTYGGIVPGYTPKMVVWLTPANWWTNPDRSPTNRDAIEAFLAVVRALPITESFTVQHRMNLVELLNNAINRYDNSAADPDRKLQLAAYVQPYDSAVNNGAILF